MHSPETDHYVEPPIKMGKSFLRWAGSKKKLLHILAAKAPDSFERYVEPFMGSGCFFFHLRAKKALLGDLNEELVCTMKAVRDSPLKVSAALGRFPRADKSTYLRLRSQDCTRFTDKYRAARFIYLNRYCFNGLWRTNLQGRFNVPFAPLKTGELPTRESLAAASKSLGSASIVCRDFEDVLGETEAGDFVYLDPPYRIPSRRVFREYGPKAFSEEDFERLIRALHRLDRKKIPFLLSYAYSPEAKRMFHKWNMQTTWTDRNVAGFSQHRRSARELLVWNKFCNPQP